MRRECVQGDPLTGARRSNPPRGPLVCYSPTRASGDLRSRSPGEGEIDVIELVYQLLEQVGFTHPLHPAITHLPMGMTMGAFLFGVASLRYGSLATTARHCAVLGAIFVPPTMIAGIFDWQHYYDGDWSSLFITKFVLAFLLPILLLSAVAAGSRERADSRFPIVLYALCLFTAIGLGYIGGEIGYG